MEENCIFCKIARGEIPSATVYEDETFRGILDVNPMTKGHALLVPKAHYADLCALDHGIAAKALPVAARIGGAMKDALGCDGFNILQNNGAAAEQSVFHFHLHIIPRYAGDGKRFSGGQQGADAQELQDTAAKIRSAVG
ncbi:MAG: HIT family protein [Lachnospiraceae bacterium]|jgi:histidine triad (HIT) family protein|nr:HIT family protein [Lachnospiraceae bacterium]